MKSVRVVESDWGGKAHEIAGALELYGYKFTVETVKSGAHLQRLCEEAIAKPKMPTLVLLSEGLINQFGKKIRDKVPPEAGGLKVIWIGVPTPLGYKAPPGRKVAEDGPIDEAALIALGETTERRRDILAALAEATGPRFCDAVLTNGIFYLYLNERDSEFHVPIAEAAEHFDKGDLRPWIRALTGQVDPPAKKKGTRKGG